MPCLLCLFLPILHWHFILLEMFQFWTLTNICQEQRDVSSIIKEFLQLNWKNIPFSVLQQLNLNCHNFWLICSFFQYFVLYIYGINMKQEWKYPEFWFNYDILRESGSIWANYRYITDSMFVPYIITRRTRKRPPTINKSYINPWHSSLSHCHSPAKTHSLKMITNNRNIYPPPLQGNSRSASQCAICLPVFYCSISTTTSTCFGKFLPVVARIYIFIIKESPCCSSGAINHFGNCFVIYHQT